ncbi:LemA family protein [Clostridium kluyveri]|uniref:LemA family protein n=1 Tax=Clostridium kluyveri TaxID=1534 RepID=A0A1L5F9M5_CLOKL|nr:LemA family protein [Clostridium kluyveri]APM39715.1 hypothetical protein BS101_13720 [Clostridium kluyveri]UZQ50123.1 LemA family protein [Clostridium kluyveri]
MDLLTSIILSVIILISIMVLITVIWWIMTSNNFKRTSIKISEALSGIEVALTKRYDMLTKLLDVAKGYTSHEKTLFMETITLRKGMSVSEINDADNQINTMASRINAIAEAYPELRSSDVFCELQAGIRDAEEHLQAARRLYNSIVTQYNTTMAVFPSSIVANFQKLTPVDFFKTEEWKKADVKIQF